MEYKVAYDGPAHAMVTARPDDLHRAVTNLVENAVKYGGEIAIRLPLPPNGTAPPQEKSHCLHSPDRFRLTLSPDAPTRISLGRLQAMEGLMHCTNFEKKNSVRSVEFCIEGTVDDIVSRLA